MFKKTNNSFKISFMKNFITLTLLFLFNTSAFSYFDDIWSYDYGYDDYGYDTYGGSSLYSDGFGGVYGSIGDDSVNLYGDGFGGVYGSIGDDSVNLFGDGFGGVYGSIGDESISCFDDGFGGLFCN